MYCKVYRSDVCYLKNKGRQKTKSVYSVHCRVINYMTQGMQKMVEELEDRIKTLSRAHEQTKLYVEKK